MWWRLLLMILYAALLFILARILETVAFYDHGFLASRLLDPFSLSVRRLKLLLDQRGVGYHGIVEKKELSELLENTGDVTDGELESATNEEESLQMSRNFTSGSHFYEEVEDTKDSIWLVQVVKERHKALISDLEWQGLVKRLVRFGVRTGIFDCSSDWRLCMKKGWSNSQIVLAYPHGLQAKDNVVLRSFNGVPSVDSIFEWVNLNIASRIRGMYNWKDIEQEQRAYKKIKQKQTQWVSLYYFSSLRKIPMFLSFLSIKFTGRVKFRRVNIHTKEGKNILKKLGFDKAPLYFIMTPEKNFTYGQGRGEYYTFSALEMFIRMLNPEVNDIFKLSLLLLNCCCFLEFFLRQGGPIRRTMKLFWALGKYNCSLLLLWLPILGFMRLPASDYVIFYALKCVRFISSSSIAGWIRQDILLGVYNTDFLLAVFLLLGVVVGIYEYKRTGGVEEDMSNPDWWSLTWDGYTSYLFQPMATLSRPMTPQDLDLEEGMELLIERLAVPNLWLQPMIHIDYIKTLPVWKYRGPVTDSPVSSDGEGYESSDGAPGNPALEDTPVYVVKTSTLAGQASLSEMSHQACANYVMDGNYQCQCTTEKSCQTPPVLSNDKSDEQDLNEKSLKKLKESIKRDKSKTDHHGDTSAFPPGMMFSSECVICLDTYKYGVLLCGLPCGHSFHEVCIMEWLTRDKHCCPVCRWATYKSKPVVGTPHAD